MPVKNIVVGQKIARAKAQRARELRREMTAAEARLWTELRTNKLGGLHFRRQQVIDGFIVDFYCHECALIVEADGSIHDLQKDHDIQRQSHLEARGFHVMRISNDEVLGHTDHVLDRILKACLSLRHPLSETGRVAGDLGFGVSE